MTNFRDQIPAARRLIKIPGPEVALLFLLGKRRSFPEDPKLTGRRRNERGKFYWEMWCDLGKEVGF